MPRAAPGASSPISCRPAGRRGGRVARRPWLAFLEEAPPVPGPGATRALLDLSRELAQAHAREDVAAALARALSSLFPGRAHCIRLLDPKTLAPVAPWSQRPGRSQAPLPISLRRAAVRHGGLSEAALESGGVRLVDVDVPVCAGCVRAVAVPLAAGSQLFGVVSLEYPPGAPGDPAADEPLLLQVTNPAALGVRNLRSVEELTFLKTYLEELLENANALIVVTNRQHQVLVFNRAIARLTGLGGEEALGADLLALLPDRRAGADPGGPRAEHRRRGGDRVRDPARAPGRGRGAGGLPHRAHRRPRRRRRGGHRHRPGPDRAPGHGAAGRALPAAGRLRAAGRRHRPRAQQPARGGGHLLRPPAGAAPGHASSTRATPRSCAGSATPASGSRGWRATSSPTPRPGPTARSRSTWARCSTRSPACAIRRCARPGPGCASRSSRRPRSWAAGPACSRSS